ncbi:hypothetical protein J132_08617 [Termitomyces sp. J132]|nr:hypothetical protein J132_08617 [Termitomyces sp. J132]
MMRWAVHDETNELPTDSRIWESLKDKDLSRETRAFLWKTMHNGYKVGRYWENIPNFERRALCGPCDNVHESMNHILTECLVSGQDVVWDLTQTIHEKRGLIFDKPSLGKQLGCALIVRGTGRDKQGASRFSRMIVSEASRTIWKIRCEWRISRETDFERRLNEVEIKNTLRRAIAQRMRLDCLATDKSRFGRKTKSAERVKNTWKNFMPERVDPAKAWRKATEVLVGIG